MKTAVTGIYMFIVMQEDLEQGVEFYKKLGLTVVFHIPNKWAELQAGQVKIGLCPSATVAKGHHVGLVFEVENLKETYAVLQNEGVSFANEPTIATHGVMVSCIDPSGNLFDLYQPTHDKVKEMLQKAGKLCNETCTADGQKQCCKVAKNSGGCC